MITSLITKGGISASKNAASSLLRSANNSAVLRTCLPSATIAISVTTTTNNNNGMQKSNRFYTTNVSNNTSSVVQSASSSTAQRQQQRGFMQSSIDNPDASLFQHNTTSAVASIDGGLP
eukprot:8880327-Ditylum_brightwellii.AAC.1